ncbi:hydrogenase nickel incorporation protein HypB [Alkalicella caledoniensis]|uniref:Hydrogenase nickel incorporation protein HypB n=1 Tax=Alkalicella caledoniensis TaxID=2731377 RepID=A0A7G9W6G4_ALKCA|nr:hydrogenase nickel incorporation protein HypB [Alkalicella caledoniensis]QNO14276.1 hydrogenase nickel incorporation protein HypB [Alkalicella caledoniensis]
MEDYKVIKVKKSVYENNNLEAEKVRERLKSEKTFLLNLMSSPGSGKTTTVVRTIKSLKDKMKMGVIEADIDSYVDAEKVAKAGAKAIQLQTGGMCHIDAIISRDGLDSIGSQELDFVIIENIGNLVCPASYDLGACKNAMILSVPEGDDKPLKYPKMFSTVDALIINKIDTMEYFDFDLEAVRKRVKEMNPNIEVFEISAKTGQGFDQWTQWLERNITQWNR